MTGTFSLTINGRAVTTPETDPVLNPATRQLIGEVPIATPEILDEAVAAARAAFPQWAASGYGHRKAVLVRAAERIRDHAEELAQLLTSEQGKPLKAARTEINDSAAWLNTVAAQELTDEIVDESDRRRVTVRHTPLGVVGAIVPWNFPVMLLVWKIAPALITGNTVIVKPSPFTPLTALRIVTLLADVLPPGVLSAVSGTSELGEWMTAHPGFAKISFTGSTETGKKVMKSAADHLTHVTLELGGNDPAIVLPSADPKPVARELFWAAFQNSGQFCTSAKRIYVHDDIYDEVLHYLCEYGKTVTVGDGMDPASRLGPIQNEPQYLKLVAYLDDCAENGYQFALGGTADLASAGRFIPVTIVDNPPDDARIVVEEQFGPVIPVLRWQDEEDVLRRANDSVWGLAASVWSGPGDEDATERIARQLDVGTVWINDIHIFSPEYGFSGHKLSGIGVENGLDGLAEFTALQTLISVPRG